MGEFAKALSDIAAGYAAIATAFENLSKVVKQDTKKQAAEAVKTEKETPEPETKLVEPNRPAPPIEEVKKTAEDISQPVKLELVRAVLATLTQQGKRDEVKKLLLKYGAPKLSGIDPKNYVALVKDAQALTNNAA